MSKQKMISEPNAGNGTLPAAGLAVERRLEGEVEVLTMRQRPHNLLGPALCRYIIDAMTWAGTSGARAVLLRSGLRHFSAGAGLDQMLAAADEGESVLDWPLLDTLRALEDLPLPIVAAVHGTCLGGGPELALACDLTVVSESAKIGCVEASVGLHPLMGAVQRIAEERDTLQAPVDWRRVPAFQGEHNEDVLGELGYPGEEITALRRSGALIRPGLENYAGVPTEGA
ncbi:enoyl-CoA hydratase/isomerase family protein [Actinacidiphila soli]|uniref:enoyl-CoA hydratase/isomerase family protein n=1 Tax=Actinacidiphila soli TaxID=2487275 RepID=UPI0019D118C2|nr:enoyl-CoA hydratase/isomerase family protein [Actinacidiphila soli]